MRRLLAVSLSALLSAPAGVLAQPTVATPPVVETLAPPPPAALSLGALGGGSEGASGAASGPQAPSLTDPLADLITASQTTDEEDEAPAAAPPPRHRPTILPIPAPEPAAPAAASGAMSVEQAYELRVKGSIAAAQGLQGPLDGGWLLRGADGTGLYALQIADPAGGYGPVEGAWRDLRRPGAVGSTGLIDGIERTYDGGAAVRFMARPGVGATLTARAAGDGGWTGQLVEDGAAPIAVAIERTGAPILPVGYAVASRGPVVWPPRAAPAARPAPTPARAPTCATRGKTGKALKAARARCAAAAKAGGRTTAKAGARKGGKAVVGKGKAGKGKATTARRKRR